jgi:type 1 glutamine amidotransferase
VSKLRALLLIGGAEYHNRAFHTGELAGILAGEAGADLRITDDLESLNDAGQYDVFVNWSTFVKPSDEQVAALLAAVEGGVGLFAIHGGAATFWNSSPYLRALGSRFVRHDPYKLFKVDVVDRSHPITAGVEDFEVEDELYEQGGDAAGFDLLAEGTRAGKPNSEMRELGDGPLAADIKVLAEAEGHPLLYVKSHGKGRVHYNALGHDQKALTHPAFRRLIRQGLLWTAGR